jgi:hypothetical protein
MSKLLLFGAGYATGQVTHEVGHWATARIVGVRVVYQWDERYFPPPIFRSDKAAPRSLRARIAEGGFVAEVVSSEIILLTSDLRTDDGGHDYYLYGWLAQSILSPIGYVAANHINPNGYGDLHHVGVLVGRERENIVEAFIVAHALLSVARIAFKMQPDDRVAITSNSQSVSLSLRF